jgi:signal transduction histidine kinase/ActR/RegA family two-component response regulator
MSEAPGSDLDRYRQALEASEARFRNVIERNADGVVVVSRDGVILYMNPAAEEMFGCQVNECIGTTFGIPVAHDAQTEVDIPRDGSEPVVAEMRVVRSEWEGQPAYLASLRDVTERKRVQSALVEADRRKDEFLAMLAHELRNPLATLAYAVEVISPEDDPQVDSEAREIANRQIRHLARMVDDLLEVSRITRGKIVLKKSPVDLCESVRSVVQSVQPLIELHGHHLELNLTKGSCYVEADPTRLEQIFSNLINNSIKYTPSGGRVSIAMTTTETEAIVTVADDGIGIPHETLPRVFDLFAQADQSLARSGGGLGIGLTLVRQLVELHGGSVSVLSDGPGRGSEFTVRMPLTSHRPIAEPSESAAAPLAGQQLKILIVEDQPALALMLSRLLQRHGHTVRAVGDGPSGLDAVPSFRPEIVFLDIGLPGMSGYEVAAQLCRLPEAERPMLVALTGYGRDEDRKRCLEAGFDRHLVKPVSASDLEAIFAEAQRLFANEGHQRTLQS